MHDRVGVAEKGAVEFGGARKAYQQSKQYCNIDELMGLITRQNLPFNFWNDPSVRNLFSGFAEKFKVPCSSDSMTSLLKPYAQGVRDRLWLEVKDKLQCLKFDIATRRYRSFIGISFQFIDKWKIEMRALKNTDDQIPDGLPKFARADRRLLKRVKSGQATNINGDNR